MHVTNLSRELLPPHGCLYHTTWDSTAHARPPLSMDINCVLPYIMVVRLNFFQEEEGAI